MRSCPGPQRVASRDSAKNSRQPHLLGLPHHFGGSLPDFSAAPPPAGPGPLHEKRLIPLKEIEGLDGALFQMAF